MPRRRGTAWATPTTASSSRPSTRSMPRRPTRRGRPCSWPTPCAKMGAWTMRSGSIERSWNSCRRCDRCTRRSRSSTRRPDTADWAATARKQAAAISIDCAKHKAECDFGAKRFEQRWQPRRTAPTPSRCTGVCAPRTSWAAPPSLPWTVSPMRASGGRCAPRWRGPTAATPTPIEEIQAALGFAPDDPRLLEELGTSVLSRPRLRAGAHGHCPAPQRLPRFGDAPGTAGRDAARAPAVGRGPAAAQARRGARARRYDGSRRAGPRLRAQGRVRGGHPSARGLAQPGRRRRPALPAGARLPKHRAARQSQASPREAIRSCSRRRSSGPRAPARARSRRRKVYARRQRSSGLVKRQPM